MEELDHADRLDVALVRERDGLQRPNAHAQRRVQVDDAYGDDHNAVVDHLSGQHPRRL